jgi:hypothetical protein|tara:strand:+ start:18900 stop:19151 length:252 start_codon:yes stop_codon:yes gene_type:complete
MTVQNETLSSEAVIIDLLRATSQAILESKGVLADQGYLFDPVTNAILFLKQENFEPPALGYELLLELITTGAAARLIDSDQRS